MLIYLDTCCIQRPKDEYSPLNDLQAKAIRDVLDLVKSGAVRLLSSPVLELEIGQIPDSKHRRRVHAMGVISLADTVATVSGAAYAKAREIEPKCKEIKLSDKELNDCLDALHAAVAIEHHADYFCTADKRLLKKLKALRERKALDWGFLPYFVSPLELAEEIISQ